MVGEIVLAGSAIQIVAFPAELVAQLPETVSETDLMEASMPLRESPAKMASMMCAPVND